jgi:FAD/FMN-containing dehydrogenase
MILDALLSVRIVTASGRVVVASTSQNADLFWAIRGAGFNYGIITEATYRVADLTSPLVVNGDFAFPANASSALMNYLTSFGEYPPAKLALILVALYDAASSRVCAAPIFRQTAPRSPQ